MALNLGNILPGVIICPDIGENTIPRACCSAVFLAPMTDGAESGDYELQRVASKSNAIRLFGAGSPAADMAAMYFGPNPFGELNIVGYNPTGAAATGQIALTGTATENGIANVFINGDVVTVDILSGDTAGDVAAAIALAEFGPADVVASGDNADFTARFGGAEGNQVQLQLEMDVEGLTAAVTPMSGGAGLPDFTRFYDALGDCCCYDFIGVLGYDDVTMDAASANLAKRWGCECFTGGRFYNAIRGTFGEISTHLANRQGKDPFGSTIMVCPEERIADYEKLAAFIGRAHLMACTNPSRTWYEGELTGVPNVETANCVDSCFDRQERNVLALNGLTTIINGPNGYQIIESDTGRGRVNAQGEVDLFLAYPQSAYQTSTFARLFSSWAERFNGLNISTNEINPPRGIEVLTPNMFRAEFKSFLREHEGSLVENVEASLDLVTFEQDQNNPSNACVIAYFDPISAFRLFTVSLRPRINLQNFVTEDA